MLWLSTGLERDKCEFVQDLEKSYPYYFPNRGVFDRYKYPFSVPQSCLTCKQHSICQSSRFGSKGMACLEF